MATHRLSAGLALMLCLAGCATESRFSGTGAPIPPPPGWVEYCKRVPLDPGCVK